MHTSNTDVQGLKKSATHFLHSQNVSRSISMTSSEIAELTGKFHAHVIRDIRVMLKALGDDPVLDDVLEDKDSRGYTENYHLNRELTETLVTGYSVPLRLKVIRRLHELEEKTAKPAFDISSLNDPKVLLALLTDNVRKVVALEADNSELSHENLMLEQKVAADAPKAAFFDAVTVTHETYSVAEAAKLIGTGQNRLMAFLRQRRWVTLRKNEPMQGPIESGYLTAKLSTFEHPENGKTTVSTPRVTGKGLTKLQALWARRDADLLGDAA
ncbi:phage antirepressor KilAC domain-containing protein [Pseudomonas sp. Y24-6]|uniref:phage antirepressor KilAC domain-containing protein n=1 Tax=Pseudomonas sp. Y24-6 TaxID=2750013 RepID=UPI001CE0A062|nr:phage regulatory protein/antirepressor Ant [Pseudomonas sp. Y24-6]MCA4965903.1 phage antirepressor KilAC domain-containing protein [Pseudomonas sp. Y24-6]